MAKTPFYLVLKSLVLGGANVPIDPLWLRKWLFLCWRKEKRPVLEKSEPNLQYFILVILKKFLQFLHIFLHKF